METLVGHPERVWMIGMVFVTILLASWMAWRRRRMMRHVGKRWQQMVTPRAPWIRTALLCGTFLFLTAALVDFRWGKTTHEIPQKGIEVMFALDVSRSMLAEDVSPSRLERAKQQIRDLMDEMAGDRVGLVAFAGEAINVIPMTRHYEDFLTTLEGLGPHSVRVGGSRLGDALQAASEGFLEQSPEHRVIVVLTDGEDHESDPVGVAKNLFQESGTRVFTIGLGDGEKGSRVPGEENQFGRRRQPYVTYGGDEVWSRLDGATLKAVALETSGAYIPAGTRYVDMGQVYQRYIAPIEKTDFESATVDAYEARFQWFALPALLCLLGEVLWSTASVTRKSDAVLASNSSALARTAAVVLGIALSLTVGTAGAQALAGKPAEPAMSKMDQARAINQANQLVREGKTSEALAEYEALNEQATASDPWLAFNRSVALAKSGQWDAAREGFQQASTADDRLLARDARYNLGNALVQASESDTENAESHLTQAIAHYRDALRLDPELRQARANIEAAYHRLQDLKEQSRQESDSSEDTSQEQDSEQNQKSQQDQGSQEDQQESGNQEEPSEQDSQQQESQSPQDRQDGSQSQSGQDDQQQEKQQGQQSEPQDGQQGESSSDSENQNDSDSKESQGSADASSQQPSDGSASDQPQESTQEPQANTGRSLSQDQDRDEMSQASDSVDSDQDQQPQEQAKDGKLDSTSKPTNPKESMGDGMKQESEGQQGNRSVMSLQEAMKMLQAIRDRQYQRSLDLQRRQQNRHIPVEKDW